MCTVALSFQADRRWPLVVAANRDEKLGRDSEGWAVRHPTTGPRYVAPLDLLAGGTWIGVSESGLFAAVTNHYRPESGFPDPRRSSRGELVPRALLHPTASQAREALSSVQPSLYNPFHLVVADASRAFLWWYDGDSAIFEDLSPGLHIVTESDRDGRSPRSVLVRRRWPVEPDPALLRDILAVHGPGLDGSCVHLDPVYGTRSSTILRLAHSLDASELFVTEARPCCSPLEDRSRLLHDLSRFGAGGSP